MQTQTEEKIGVQQQLFDPRGENTIQINPGDKLLIVEAHDSGWTYVKNLITEKCGWVPAWVVTPLPE